MKKMTEQVLARRQHPQVGLRHGGSPVLEAAVPLRLGVDDPKKAADAV